MKKLLRSHPLTRRMYAFARAVYLLFYDMAVKLLKAWIRWRSKNQGYRVFRWNGFTIREEWKTPYAAGNIINGLKEFSAMADMAVVLCGPSPVIFDVGANIGLSALAFSRINGASVYGFEPTPSTFSFFEENIRINNVKNIIPVNIGLSDKKASMLIGPPKIDSDSGNFTVYVNQDDPAIRILSQEARFDTLDNYIADNDIRRMDYLKVDVEGHEINFLKGGIATIKKFRPIIQLEYYFCSQQMAKHTPEELLSLLHEINYTIFIFEVLSSFLSPLDINELVNHPEAFNTEFILKPNA
ncbi:MAG: hypothetical protein A3G18_09385 [Rhodospirillales bacterium RIFCSPLOWO2_12_FULL_58_28]|nr:MAG: hypothetical protein A3H92_02285 [Rhodospirillales bacterium RIFCSPLOWO2_02_FULL_58_16]OHC76717.1 MAG: hypothetical protein A3G18_09385 [Rhodospirillales bacterium RIFCSPLOWO2_12_FULL_58_28]